MRLIAVKLKSHLKLDKTVRKASLKFSYFICRIFLWNQKEIYLPSRVQSKHICQATLWMCMWIEGINLTPQCKGIQCTHKIELHLSCRCGFFTRNMKGSECYHNQIIALHFGLCWIMSDLITKLSIIPMSVLRVPTYEQCTKPFWKSCFFIKHDQYHFERYELW